jgi:tRNA A37 threonylcarbamoyladenosine modification protein TsaB
MTLILPNARDVVKVALSKLAIGKYVDELKPLYIREADAVKSNK